MRRIGRSRPVRYRCLDLREIIILPVPEHRPPRGVQRVDIAVAGDEPSAECVLRHSRMAFGKMSVELIVRLPADDVRGLPR